MSTSADRALGRYSLNIASGRYVCPFEAAWLKVYFIPLLILNVIPDPRQAHSDPVGCFEADPEYLLAELYGFPLSWPPHVGICLVDLYADRRIDTVLLQEHDNIYEPFLLIKSLSYI
jgi:hypothetical protein